MSDILNYTPGQQVTFYQEVKDGYNRRTDDGYIPVITRVILPNLTLVSGYPAHMIRFDTGLYYFQFTLPIGASAVGTYLVDIVYMDPVTAFIVNTMKQVVVTAPFGNYGVTI